MPKKLGNLDQMNKFLDIQKLSKLTQKDRKYE